MEPKDLQAQLDILQKNFETATDAKVKAGIEAEIKAVKEQLAAATKDVPEIRKELDTTKTELAAAKTEIAELKATVTKDEADKKANQEALDGALSDIKALKTSKPRKEDMPTFGESLEKAFNDGENFKNIEMLANNHKDRLKKFSIELKAVGDVSVSGNYTGGSRALQVMAPGIIQNPPRKVHVRQLVPQGTIGAGTSYVFMRENGDGEGAIAPTAESTSSSTGLKPQIDIDLVEASVNIETIAGILKVSRKAMNNIPGFLSFLQTRLPEKLLRIEDAQLLAGNGVSPNIKGIMTAGNFTAANTSSLILAEQLIDGISQLEEMDRNATGILLRPEEYYSFFKHKSAGSGEYDLPRNFVYQNGILYISGVPTFVSTAMPVDQYIIGDWQMGAQLLIQEGMRVEFFEQDSDNVQRNKITVRIEETIAFPVYGDQFFINGNAGS